MREGYFQLAVSKMVTLLTKQEEERSKAVPKMGTNAIKQVSSKTLRSKTLESDSIESHMNFT